MNERADRETALDEHLALTRGQNPEPGTLYHQTVTGFRRTLVKSSLMWDKMGEPHRTVTAPWATAAAEARKNGTKAPERPPQAVFDADAACMMASSYAYTLAAIIRLAGEEFGQEVMQCLASAADDMLINGDCDSLNADVLPEGEGVPGPAQGIELILPAPPQEAEESAHA